MAQDAPQRVLAVEDTPGGLPAPSPQDVLRYRYHHGTNLGSIFVLERWLHPSMFVQGTNGDSELDAVNASLRVNGLEGTRQKWENHWRNAVSDADFDWLVNAARCTSIRLPVGWFTLGPDFCHGTAFEGEPAQVYVNAWRAVRDLVSRARSRGIGVLLDVHALPGGANWDAHSGTSSGQAALWGNGYFLDLGRRCLVFVAGEARSMDGVVGLQLVNEAVTNAAGMYEWYGSILHELAQVDASLPIYISDRWNLAEAVGWVNGRNTLGNRGNPVVIDTHKYYTFAESDRQQSPQQILERVPNELGELNGREGSVFDGRAVEVVVGEYSCVMDDRTWSRVAASEKGSLVAQFGQAQSRTWQARSAGCYFWTYKMDWMDGGEWGFAAMTKSGAVRPPPWLLLPEHEVNAKLDQGRARRGELRGAAVGQHIDYWNRTSPGQAFEHWRYEYGWDVGYSDAVNFFGMRARGNGQLVGPGADKIGVLDLWVRKRMFEAGQVGSHMGWEFEQGFRRGAQDFYNLVGI